MTCCTLHCHPNDTPPPGLAVSVRAEYLDGGDLRLIYRIRDARHSLLLPLPLQGGGWVGDGCTTVEVLDEQTTVLTHPHPGPPLEGEGVYVPPPGPSDNLWQHTCCEAFIATAQAAAYREFNFSPSGAWAAYDFAAYRERNAAWQASTAPRIGTQGNAADFLLTAEIPRALLPAAPWRLGLTFIAEAQDAGKSYWALAHAAARPDFHLAASFTLPLP